MCAALAGVAFLGARTFVKTSPRHTLAALVVPNPEEEATTFEFDMRATPARRRARFAPPRGPSSVSFLESPASVSFLESSASDPLLTPSPSEA